MLPINDDDDDGLYSTRIALLSSQHVPKLNRLCMPYTQKLETLICYVITGSLSLSVV